MTEVIALPHFQQSADGQCLPACGRMVLTYLGMSLSEAEVGRTIGAKPFGTPTFAIQRLSKLGLQVNYKEWSTSALLAVLGEKRPLIAFVRTGFLDYWQEDFAHAVVVVGAVDNEQVWVHDPAKETSPLSVSWDGFLAAWAEFGYRGATVTKG